MNLALVTYQPVSTHAAAGAADEDALLARYLRQCGHRVTAVAWTDPAVAWASYELVLLKSPWDYVDRIGEFYQWLDRVASLGVRVLNPLPTVRWNADKKYLRDLAAAGVRIVPTQWLLRGTPFEPAALFEALGTERLIVKPAVSGGAKQTFSLTRLEAQAQAAHLTSLLREADFLAQPFLPQIQTEGEWSLIYLGGEYSHCVLKTPKAGDFRVQQELGGSLEPREAPAHLRASADAIVTRFAAGCLYARVDGVAVQGELLLMELELIEPYLYLTSDPGALPRYEAALRQQVARALAAEREG